MRYKTFNTFIIFLMIFIFCAEQKNISELKGAYFGQNPPGDIPEIFGAGFISTGFMEHQSPAISYDGTELYYMINFNISPRPILFTRIVNGRWKPLTVASFSGKYNDGGVTYSPNGKRLYFHSVRPGENNSQPESGSDIWFVEKTKDGWSNPENVGLPVNTEASEHMPSISEKGTLYFIRSGNNINGICRAFFNGASYSEPEILDESVNSENWDAYPFIAPDESYFMFASNRPGGFGSSDLYICYKKTDGTWMKPLNIGNSINSDRWDAAPRVSLDGKYLFFCSSRKKDFKDFSEYPLTYKEVVRRNDSAGNGMGDVFWVSAEIIEKLKPGNLK